MLKHREIMLGCDPEFFFTKDGKIVGAEKVLEENGLQAGQSRIIIDGVQAELNPAPHHKRADLGAEIAKCFDALMGTMERSKVSIDFAPTVQVDPKELSKLSDKAKQFGCAPSKNKGKVSEMVVKDASKYPYRSAGGHIHIGNYNNNPDIQKVLDDPDMLVPILDIIVGNTCVLLDRHEGNIERRKVYGRAGEYRTPPHGVEYRTLSNFWLKSPQLMSLVTGLARQAVQVCADGYADKFMELVDIDNVTKAINENNEELAFENLMRIAPLLMAITPEDSHFPLHNGTYAEFMHFAEMGLDYWFSDDVLGSWVEMQDIGFEEFLLSEVKYDLK